MRKNVTEWAALLSKRNKLVLHVGGFKDTKLFGVSVAFISINQSFIYHVTSNELKARSKYVRVE